MNNKCPHCISEIDPEAKYCAQCSRIVVSYVFCNECKEPFSNEASICPNCSSVASKNDHKLAERIELQFTATRIGAFLTSLSITALFFPPCIKVHKGQIMVKKWTLLGLRVHQQELQVSKIASVGYTKGIFWGSILVETFGGSSDDLCEHGLLQSDAQLMAEKLKACLTN